MKPGLFRREVFESRRQLWLGEIRLARPLSLTLLTTVVVVAAAATAAFLFEGHYTRKARLAGVLVPDLGTLRVVAPQAATVVERRAVEGQAVAKGDVLFVLSTEQTSTLGGTQAAVQRSLQARERSLADAAAQEAALLAAQREDLQRRIAEARAAVGVHASQIDLHRQQLALAQAEHDRWRALQDQYVSAARVEAEKVKVLAAHSALRDTELKRAQAVREIATLEAQWRQLPLQAQSRQGEIERQRAELAQDAAVSEARRRIVVTAPASGVLSAVTADAQGAVGPAVPLATVVPSNARLLAHLYASSASVGFLRPHQTVLLRYQAFPYQKFGHHKGEVLQVSRTPLGPGEHGQAAAEPLYRVTVALERQSVDAYGQPQALVPGMQLEADVQLDRRRLIEWIFEPVIGLQGRV